MNNSLFPGIRSRHYPAILLLALVLNCLFTIMPVTGTDIECHRTGRMGLSGSPEPSQALLTGDTLVSEVCLADVRDGDQIRWELHSPAGTPWNEIQDLSAGQQRARMAFDLDHLPLAEVTGTWDLDLFLNDHPIDHTQIDVHPPTGLSWWGPLAGASLVLLVLAGIGGIAIIVVLAISLMKKP